MSQEDAKRKLASLKTYLERRVSELNKESAELNSFLQVIDAVLAEKSFRKIEIPKERIESTALPHPELERGYPQETPILTAGGMFLGEMLAEDNNITVIPNEEIKFELNSPPLRAFLMARVLEPIKARDAEMCKEGKLSKEKTFTYEIDQKDGFLKAILIHNFGDEKRFLELQNAIRWTLRRIYEKSLQK